MISHIRMISRYFTLATFTVVATVSFVYPDQLREANSFDTELFIDNLFGAQTASRIVYYLAISYL